MARRRTGEGVLDTLPVVRLRQVHGAAAVRATKPGCPGAYDGVAVRVPGLAAVVATADCLPVFLADPRGGVALAHAGWRGLLAGVIESTLEALGAGTGVSALLGPALGVCCFEVGPEVAERFPPETVQHRRPRPHVDLARAARLRLLAAGVAPERISPPGPCTRCHRHVLYSYRGSGGGRGRLLAYVTASPARTLS